MNIIGAGLAGLLAGSIFPKARIYEAGLQSQMSHKAVLRFRSPAVGNAVGIDFRKVVVHKGVYSRGSFVAPNIRLANQYSQKVIGKIADRSIWKVEPAERYIAPEDFISQMIERCEGRINWDFKIEKDDIHDFAYNEPTISTIPMPTLAKLFGYECPVFKFAPITVRRWRIADCDTFQTIYFPDPNTSLYRASITGNLLIAEYIGDTSKIDESDLIFVAFGINPLLTSQIDEVKQSYGKIAPIDEQWRRQFILKMSMQKNIFSVGRFATWRNILLDDVLGDISTVKRLINGGIYEYAKAV